jgi:hypothetical protein
LWKPQIAALLVSPSRVFREHAEHDVEPRFLDIAAALSAPTAVVGAAVAFSYADALLLGHLIGNVMLLTASFAIQSFAAAFVGRVLYRRSARATLLPFALTLVPHEVFWVGLTAMLLVAPSRGGFAFALGLGALCMAWNVVLTYKLFRSLGSRLRGVLAVWLHFTTIAVLVGLYMRAQDLLPYPPGRP